MACLEMYNQKNTEKKSAAGAAAPPPPMSPRISFSNDFADPPSQYSHSNPHHHHHHHQVRAAAYREAPVSSDFQFPVRKHSMMSADELFSKGRLLPSKESCCSSNSQKTTTTTLRDELLNENEGSFSIMRPPSNKNPTSWRGLLGIRSKKSERALEKRTAAYSNNNHNHDGDDDDDVRCTKKSQDFVD